MYNLIKKIGDNEKYISYFVFIGIALIFLDILSGFQATRISWGDIWHHRAVLLALTENPFNPSNPHILSDEGSRSFIPVYVVIGFLSSLFGFSANVSLGISSIINLFLLVLGAKYFARALGSQRFMILLFILFFAWLYPPNYVSFNNIRSIVQTNAYPAAHSFGLTLIIWGLFIEIIKKSDLQLVKWTLITALLTLNILSHQLTAMFCIGGIFLFIFISPVDYVMSALKALGALIVAILISLLWPYFDLVTVLSSASNSGWEPAKWLFNPLSVLKISLPALFGLIFLAELRHLRLVRVIMLCAIGVFSAYIGTQILGIEAGLRLLPYWIFFLQIILFIAFRPEITASLKTPFIDKVRPVFLFLVMVLAVGQIFLTIVDIYKPVLRYQYGWTFLRYDPELYFKAMEKINQDLPKEAIVVAHSMTAFPIQGFGIHVVSIPRQAPMISDLPERQAATEKFFALDSSCEQRIEAVRPYRATHAAYITSHLDKKIIQQISMFGEVITYNNLISIVEIPSVCPASE